MFACKKGGLTKLTEPYYCFPKKSLSTRLGGYNPEMLTDTRSDCCRKSIVGPLKEIIR